MRCNLSFLPSNFVELKIVTLLVVTCSHLLFSERSSFMAAFFLCLRLAAKVTALSLFLLQSMSTPFAAPLYCANGRKFASYVASSATASTLYEGIHPTTPAKYCGDVCVNACEKCRLFAKVTQNHPNFLKKRRICYILPKVTPISI